MLLLYPSRVMESSSRFTDASIARRVEGDSSWPLARADTRDGVEEAILVMSGGVTQIGDEKCNTNW